MRARAAAALGALVTSLTGCGPPPAPAPLDTGLYRSGVPHPMSASGFGVFSTLLARDGFSARLTKLSLKGFEYVFEFDQRDPAGRIWRAECAQEWEIHAGQASAADTTTLRCAATLGEPAGADEYAITSLELRSEGLDGSARKPWTGRFRGGSRPPGSPGAEGSLRTVELAVRGDGSVFTAGTDRGAVALLQVMPEPGTWVAAGPADDLTTPGIFFMAAALVFARTALPARPPPEYLDQRQR